MGPAELAAAAQSPDVRNLLTRSLKKATEAMQAFWARPEAQRLGNMLPYAYKIVAVYFAVG